MLQGPARKVRQDIIGDIYRGDSPQQPKELSKSWEGHRGSESRDVDIVGGGMTVCTYVCGNNGASPIEGV